MKNHDRPDDTEKLTGPGQHNPGGESDGAPPGRTVGPTSARAGGATSGKMRSGPDRGETGCPLPVTKSVGESGRADPGRPAYARGSAGEYDRADASYRELLSILSRARRRLALTSLTGGIVRLLCVAIAGLAIALALAAVLPPSVPGVLTLTLLWLSVAVTGVGAFIVLPLVRLPSLDALAVRMDSALAPGANPLISSVQLGRRLREGDDGRWVSLAIMSMAVRAGAENAKSMDSRSVTSDPDVGRWLRQLALVSAISLAMIALWPGQLRTSVWRLTHPFACGPAPVQIAVAPGNAQLDAGSDLTVEAMVTGTSEVPVLRARKKGGVWRAAEMRVIRPRELKAQELLYAAVPGAKPLLPDEAQPAVSPEARVGRATEREMGPTVPPDAGLERQAQGETGSTGSAEGQPGARAESGTEALAEGEAGVRGATHGEMGSAGSAEARTGAPGEGDAQPKARAQGEAGPGGPGAKEARPGSASEIEAGQAAAAKAGLDEAGAQGEEPKAISSGESESTATTAREAEPGSLRRFYALTLKGLQEDREYNVQVADQVSATWNVEVHQPPRAVAFRMRYSYPDYTGLPPNETVSASGDIAALKGAAVQLDVSANRELDGAVIAFVSGDTLQMTPTSPRSFAGSFHLMNEDRYTISFIEPDGRRRDDPRQFSVMPLPDHRPLVRILSPERTIDLPAEMTVEVSTYAADDYGLISLALVYFMEGGEESRISVRDYDSVPRELYDSYGWDLAELGMLPGEVVYYSVEVRDNDTVSGPKASRSEIHSVRFPTMAEIYEQVEEDYEAGIDELTDALRRGTELKERLEEITRDIKRAEQLTWEQRQSVSGALSDREKLGENVQQVAESLDEIVNKLGGSELIDEEIFQKIMEIQKLLSEISNPEFLKSIEQLNEALSNVDKEALAKAMEELKANQEQLLKNLDKTIELLKRLKAEEQMQAALDQIQDLLAKQEDINSQLENDNPSPDDMSDLAGEETGVKAGLGELEESLKSLEKALEPIDPQTAAQMGEQAEQASTEGLQADAQQAADQMQAGSIEGALPAGKSVSSGLSAMSEEMSSSMQGMQRRLTQQMVEKLREAAKDLVFVSKDQESVVSSAEAESPQVLARRQFQVHSGAAQVADDLEELIRSNFSISRRLGHDLGDALFMMEKATREFSDGKKQSGLAHGWEAVPSLNKAAMELMRTGQQMQMSMTSCPSPSGEQSAQQNMQKLCSMQQDVNMGTQCLVQKVSEDGGRLQPSSEDQLARLAAQQEMVKKGMKEVAEELGGRKDILGRLDDLVEEMQNVVDEMQKRHVDRKTVRRQQQILSRLLDAQRSIRRRDLGDQRISRTGLDPLGRVSPDALPPDLLEARDRVRAEVLRGKADPVPAPYRRLVEEYFRAISAKGF